MLILWIRRSNYEEPDDPGSNDVKSFRKHADAMKRFRLGHPEEEIFHPRDIITADCNVLAPVHRVKFEDNTWN